MYVRVPGGATLVNGLLCGVQAARFLLDCGARRDMKSVQIAQVRVTSAFVRLCALVSSDCAVAAVLAFLLLRPITNSDLPLCLPASQLSRFSAFPLLGCTSPDRL